MRKIKVISCLITLGIMTLIFFFSSQNSTESGAVSGHITEQISHIVAGVLHKSREAELNLREILEFYVRKTAHFTIYASLGLSALISVKLITRVRFSYAYVYTIAFCFLYAVTDELHQLLVSGRAGRPADVLIDTAGAAVGAAVLAAIRYIFKKKYNKPAIYKSDR